MKSYLLNIEEKQIATYEIVSNDLDILKNKGEDSQKYDNNYFWDWFKEKIEYEDEELSFIVLCDEEFTIDNSIKISANHHLSLSDISDLIYEFKTTDMMVKTFPDVNLDIKIEPQKQTISAPTNTNKANPAKPSIQKYFKSQTAKHKAR